MDKGDACGGEKVFANHHTQGRKLCLMKKDPIKALPGNLKAPIP